MAGEGAAQPAGGGSQYRVQALAKGLSILTVFNERRAALALKDIVELTGVPMPTAFRLVTTLVEDGYLERLANGHYRPGPAVLSLGFAALQGNDVVQTSQTALESLAAETGETVNLGALRGTTVLYLSRLRTDSSLVTANIHVGSMLPAVYTSMGKVLLAYLDEPLLRTVLEEVTFTGDWGPNAVTSGAELREQLETASSRQFAVQDEELAAGLRSIAAPVWDRTGRVVAAVNVAVNAHLWPVDRMIKELGPPLLAKCEDISRRMGAAPGAGPRRG